MIGGGAGIWSAYVLERNTIKMKFPFRKLSQELHPGLCGYEPQCNEFVMIA
jgi:hypothetical protein